MIRRFFALSSLATLACLLTAHAFAADVASVQCTIKSVDPLTRSVTVAYTVGTAEKSITLDVSRKAEITLNGEKADLGALGPGMKATVEYDRALEIVTKIQSTGSRLMMGQMVYRLTLSLSEFGDGKFRIEKTSYPAVDDFAGEAFTLSRLPRTKATKGQDGVVRLVHDFSDPDDLSVLALQVKNVSLQRDTKVAVFTPRSEPNDPQGPRRATFPYSKRLRPPLSVIADVVEYGGGQFGFQVFHHTVGGLQCRFWSDKGRDGPFTVQVAWVEGQKQTVTDLCDEMTVSLKQPYEQQFRLPLPNARITDAFLVHLHIGVKVDVPPTTVSRLEVRGRVAPMLGVGLDEKQGVVFVKTVFPNGLGQQAGIQQGDVILAINAKQPTTLVEAMNLLSLLPIGEKAVINIQRGDKTMERSVLAE
ncbi:MAG: PDZ domain-containing protein [Planctomycetaceae bacterium]|nr:PDZ domain-containing protein [Planctomycetaceae bacterium]